MSSRPDTRLIFWPFFHKIEKELSYERWIDKYKIFLGMLESGHLTFDDTAKDPFAHFKQFCKILYLQDHNDEVLFDTFLEEAIKGEGALIISILQKALEKKSGKAPLPTTSKKAKSFDPDDEAKIQGTAKRIHKKSDGEEEAIEEEPDATEVKYFHPNISFQENEPDNIELVPTLGQEQFLHTDEYYPASTREMIKAWQYLRRKEKSGFSNRLDITATVEQVAKSGLLEKPIYQHSFVNRKDTLLILADSRGSMSAFSDLNNRLIQTAKGEGGHKRASVFYYKNIPASSLFKQANLTDRIPINEALLSCNPNLTITFIISDAGASRGNKDQKRISNRIKETRNFLSILEQKTAHIIWLNPMPEHRWKNTAAEWIAQDKSITAMIPLLEQGDYNFQDIIRKILKFKYSR